MMDRSFEIVTYLAETAGQDHDAVLGGLIDRWPDATGDEIERALAAFAMQGFAACGGLNDNACQTTD